MGGVTPSVGGAALALVPPRGAFQLGRMTGIALDTSDAHAEHARLKAVGVDVDAEMMGGDGGVPVMFFFRDHDANQVMVVEQ